MSENNPAVVFGSLFNGGDVPSEMFTEQNKDLNLIKHTATIHIEGSLSLVDRKVVNILLKNAFNEIESKEKHVIRLSDLQKLVGWSTLNDKVIKDSLDTLVGTKIKWNAFGKDKKNSAEWTASTLLASANYNKNKGQCEYSYSYHLKGLIGKPNIYAKINLLIQREFKSKHALALWEYLVEFVCSSNGGEHTSVALSDLRSIFGVDENQYKAFKDFNRSLLKPALKEINSVSDISVVHESIKSSRKVSEIAFIVKRKSGDDTTHNSSNNFVVQNEDIDTKITKDLPQDSGETKQRDLLNEDCNHIPLLVSLTKKSFNFSSRNIQALNGVCILENLQEKEIISAVKVVEKNFLSGNVKFPFAQMKVALKEGWGNEMLQCVESKNNSTLNAKLLEDFTKLPMEERVAVYPKYQEYLDICKNDSTRSQVQKWKMREEILQKLLK
ncbi:MAG: replication initiation protein [Flavobacteriales bacterium]|nr:replication initiation protein [Flavobacteriales bacterium]